MNDAIDREVARKLRDQLHQKAQEPVDVEYWDFYDDGGNECMGFWSEEDRKNYQNAATFRTPQPSVNKEEAQPKEVDLGGYKCLARKSRVKEGGWYDAGWNDCIDYIKENYKVIEK